MDLFSHAQDGPRNLLPRDGTANYFGPILRMTEADAALSDLPQRVDWRNDEYHFAGKHVVTARKIAWYGDRPSASGKRAVNPWSPDLISLKAQVEAASGHRFQTCLLNLYHTGDEGLGWHSDGERTPVASLSLGAARRFVFKHKDSKETIETSLGHGDLLVMEGETQDHWQHRVPPMKRVRDPRINLTFRQSG